MTVCLFVCVYAAFANEPQPLQMQPLIFTIRQADNKSADQAAQGLALLANPEDQLDEVCVVRVCVRVYVCDRFKG